MKTKKIGTWNGDLKTIIVALSCETQELRIKIRGKQLILRDDRVDFWQVFARGDEVCIPVYESKDEPEEILLLEDILEQFEKKKMALSSEQERLQREWGLIP